MQVVAIPCLQDNYAYLIIDRTADNCVVVDPSEAEPVQAALEREGLKLSAIWLTHHHWDHVGGIEALCDRHGPIEVLGSAYDLDKERIPRQTRGLNEGDVISFAGVEGRVLEIPGHTLGAIAYLIDGDLFSGDTLFLAGCGRVFEGTMEMMANSLSKLRELPLETKVWCGHEYTVNNLRFAQSVDADNLHIAEALSRAGALRSKGEFTVPGTIAEELETNPFLRFDRPGLMKDRDPVESFSTLRGAKDVF